MSKEKQARLIHTAPVFEPDGAADAGCMPKIAVSGGGQRAAGAVFSASGKGAKQAQPSAAASELQREHDEIHGGYRRESSGARA